MTFNYKEEAHNTLFNGLKFNDNILNCEIRTKMTEQEEFKYMDESWLNNLYVRANDLSLEELTNLVINYYKQQERLKGQK